MSKCKFHSFKTALQMQSCFISSSKHSGLKSSSNLLIRGALFIFLFCVLCNSIHAQNWQSLGSGTNVQVRKIYGDSVTDKLYAIGEFTVAGGLNVNHIARWDGSSWNTMGGSDNGPDEILLHNDHIYIAGGIGILSGKPIRGVGVWNGSTWDSIPIQPFSDNQPTAIVFALASINNELYIGGAFNSVGGIPVNNLAKWNGNNWSSLFFPLSDSYIYSICEYKGELYIGGNFYSSAYPNDTIQNIMRYNGSIWKSVGGGLHGGMDEVSSMVVFNNELYVAGTFTVAHGNPGNYIAKWDGTSWSDVGGGVIGLFGGNGQIHELKVFNNELYAGGAFSFAGGVPAQYIAKWNGTEWCGFGSVFDNGITSLAFYKDTLYAGGGFWTIDGDSMNYIAKWTGGNFVDTCGNSTGFQTHDNLGNSISVFPNPFSNSTTIQTTKPLQNASLFIYDILGKQVKKMQNISGNEIIITRAYLQNGLYFFKLTDSKGLIGNGKIIIE
jgi:hypothetical protein